MSNENPGMKQAQAFIERLKDNHGANQFVEHMIEVDQEQLAWTPFMSDEPIHQQYVYVTIDGQSEKGQILIYHNGQGVFVSRTYGKSKSGSRDFGKLMMRFWRFGCVHDMQVTRNLGRCYNEYTCTKCGHVELVDSSD